jgi:hypothetical protein
VNVLVSLPVWLIALILLWCGLAGLGLSCKEAHLPDEVSPASRTVKYFVLSLGCLFASSAAGWLALLIARCEP